MRKIFDVELSTQGRCTELALPATPWSMQDALEKLELREDESPHCVILRIHSCGALYPYLKHADALFELNALCQQLALLDDRQLAIVEGLAKMEYEQGARPVPMPRLIDMAYSTDRCHLVEEATNDYTLGRFCAENGFVPEADDLSDEAYEFLDFARIGREFRQNEGGVFTRGGYVQKHDELRQMYKTMDLTPKKPDYTILAVTSSGCEVRFPFPANEPMGTEPVRCVDCAAPALIGLSGTMGTLDLLAHRLAELEADGELPKYKAVLEATGCDETDWALSLADGLDQYAFDPKVCGPEDVARVALGIMLPDEEIELLTPCLNMRQYGQAVLEQGGGELTGYGLIERCDGGPIRTRSQDQKNEMEMM